MSTIDTFHDGSKMFSLIYLVRDQMISLIVNIVWTVWLSYLVIIRIITQCNMYVIIWLIYRY